MENIVVFFVDIWGDMGGKCGQPNSMRFYRIAEGNVNDPSSWRWEKGPTVSLAFFIFFSIQYYSKSLTLTEFVFFSEPTRFESNSALKTEGTSTRRLVFPTVHVQKQKPVPKQNNICCVA